MAVPPRIQRRRVRAWLSWALFPVAVLALFAGLVVAGLSGSSIAVLRATTAGAPVADPDVLFGTPRPIRADELLITTPLAVSAARQDFPSRPYVGLTRVEQEAFPHGAPTYSWFEVFKPQNWGYLFLGAERGLAVHWWVPFLAALVGVFWLLRALGVGAGLAAPLAVVATMTPYNAWWSSPAPSLLLGYGALAGAAMIAALRSERLLTPLAWGLLGGAATTALFLTLYPPWLVSLDLVIAALVVGYAVDARAGWRRLLLAGAGWAAVVLPVILAWSLTYRDAVSATANTIYPGQRLSVPGEAPFAWLLSAPFNPLLAGDVGATLDPQKSGIPFTNLSEVSASWLPLPVLVSAVLLVVVRWSSIRSGADGTRRPGPWTLLALTLVMSVLLAWAVLPLPEWTGTLFLERVKGIRVPLALGFAAVLVVAIAATRQPPARTRLWDAVPWVATVAATVALSMWASSHLPWDESLVSTKIVLACSAAVAAGFGLVAAGWFPRTAALLLAVFAAWSWSLVNPLYRGLGPLDDDPVVRALRPLAEAGTGDVAMVFGDPKLVALVRASGLQSLGGTTPYPDADLMRRLTPGQPTLWNNYATYRWVADPAADRVTIRQVFGSSMELRVDPCSPEITALGASWAVSDRPIEVPCLVPRQEITAGNLTRYVYTVRPTN